MVFFFQELKYDAKRGTLNIKAMTLNLNNDYLVLLEKPETRK